MYEIKLIIISYELHDKDINKHSIVTSVLDMVNYLDFDMK